MTGLCTKLVRLSLFLLCALELSACSYTGALTAPHSIDHAHQAVREALASEPYRIVSDTFETGGSEARIVARRTSTALQPFGLGAEIRLLFAGDEKRIDVDLGGPSIVPNGPWHEALVRNIRHQLSIPPGQGNRTVSSTASSRPPDPQLPSFTEQRHALIVGISSYRDNDFTTLPKARRDAEALAEFLRSDTGGNISSDRVHILVDENATRAAILKKILEIGEESSPGDMIILYFAGHGQAPTGEKTSQYLVPFDGDMSAPELTSVATRQVSDLLDGARAQRQVVVLDCCFVSPVTRADIEPHAFRSLTGTVRAVLTSTQANEKAVDGTFTDIFLETLRGRISGVDVDGNRRLSVQEVFDAVRTPVSRAARDAGGRMTPQLYGGKLAKDLEVTRLR